MGDHFRDAIHAAVSPGSIVVGFDGSDQATRAVDWAAREAVLQHRTLAIVDGFHPVARTMLGALEMEGGNRSELLHDLHFAARGELEAAADRVRHTHPDLDVETHLVDEDARQALIGASERAHLLVVGSRGRGPIRSLLLGSVSTAAAQLACCPVVVCRPRHGTGSPHGVVVGADGSRESAPVIEFAFQHASLHDLPLTVMHCFWEVVPAQPPPERAANPMDMELLLAESVAGFTELYPDVQVQLKPARGLVDLVLTQTAPDADLLVVGRRHGSSVSRHLHTSMAAAVLERAAGTVAVVPEATSD